MFKIGSDKVVQDAKLRIGISLLGQVEGKREWFRGRMFIPGEIPASSTLNVFSNFIDYINYSLPPNVNLIDNVSYLNSPMKSFSIKFSKIQSQHYKNSTRSPLGYLDGHHKQDE